MISIVVPAYNEESLLAATLTHLGVAAGALGEPYEIIVVDDASTDRTAAIASAHGARVVGVNVRQIGAARNAGARVATGELLVFVDADTLVPPEVLRGAVAAFRAGAVGGGSGARQDSNDPPWGPAVFAVAAWIMRTAGWAAGCFMFVSTDVFRRVGGFDERYFASEEIHLSRALKRVGRFVLLDDNVMTSARKAEHYSMSHSLWLMVRMAWPGSLKRRKGLEFWYTRHDKTDKT